jgi:hypothetical protein
MTILCCYSIAMRMEGASDSVIQNYKNYGKVQSGEVPSQAPITHQHRLRTGANRVAPTPKDTCFHGFSKPAPQVQMMTRMGPTGY